MRLADAFIQSDLQYIQAIHFFCGTQKMIFSFHKTRDLIQPFESSVYNSNLKLLSSNFISDVCPIMH